MISSDHHLHQSALPLQCYDAESDNDSKMSGSFWFREHPPSEDLWNIIGHSETYTTVEVKGIKKKVWLDGTDLSPELGSKDYLIL